MITTGNQEFPYSGGNPYREADYAYYINEKASIYTRCPLHPSKPSAAARWFGSTYKENPNVWIEASQLTYVSDDTPPTVFINSTVRRFRAGRDSYLAVLKKMAHPGRCIP